MEFSITTQRRADGVITIAPSGEIDLDNAHDLRGAIDDAFVGDPPSLIMVDLADVSFLDSSGISALVTGYHTAAVRGARFVVTDPSEFVYRQLYISGLVGLLGAPQPRVGTAPARTQDYDEPEPVG